MTDARTENWSQVSGEQHEVATTFTTEASNTRRAREFAIPYYVAVTPNQAPARATRTERSVQIFAQPKLPNFLLAAMAIAEQKAAYTH